MFTEGNLAKQLLVFALPFVISNLLQVLYNVVDMAIVGRIVGSEALAAVAISARVITMWTLFGIGFANGGQILLAQYLGARQTEKADQVKRGILLLCFCLSVLIILLCTVGAPMFLRLLRTPPEAWADALIYLRICGIGMVAVYGYNGISAVLRGMGNSRHPFIMVAAASGINVLLDILFVAVFHFGVAGAAWATVCGQVFAMLYGLSVLFKGRAPLAVREKIPAETLLSIVKIGFPLAVQSALANISMLFVTGLVNTLGVMEAAAFGVIRKLEHIPMTMCLGLGHAASAVIAQNIGANQIKRAQQATTVTLVATAAIYVVAAAILLSMPKACFALFTGDDAVLQYAPMLVMTAIVGFPALAIMKAYVSFAQGMRDTVFCMAIGLIDSVALRIFLSWFLGIYLQLGFLGFLLGYSLATYGSAIPSALYYFCGRWKKRVGAMRIESAPMAKKSTNSF